MVLRNPFGDRGRDEPNATGFTNAGSLGAGFDLRLTELDSAAKSVGTLNANLSELQKTLRGFGTSSGNALNRTLEAIKSKADAAASSVAGLTGAGAGGAGGGFGSGAGTAAFGGSGSWFSGATAAARPGGLGTAISQQMTGYNSLPIGIGMAGLEFMRERIGTNRNVTLQAGINMGMIGRQQGASIQDIMATMGRFPGGIYGAPEELMGLFAAAPQLGASFGFGGRQGQGVRAGGFLAGVRQAQMLNPGETVTSIAGNIAQFSANTRAQQQSAYLTGGAYSMIAAGGRQKSLSEWADDIMKWLQGLRGGSKARQQFTYGELMAQYFPGSNIDAWFEANGVPQNMRQYWWTYALAKASHDRDKTVGGVPFTITPDDTNVAWQRLRSTSELTRTEFNLGSQMTGAYLNKEQANRWFNELMGQIQTAMIPALAGGAGRFIQYLPDTAEDLLMGGVRMAARHFDRPGDVGDVGDIYGGLGGTGLSGLSPNMRSKLGPMLRANPRLRVTSGLRDTAMQRRLKAQGHSRVSGGPSAHTRGDAADLGPASEYGWIMSNAGRFGLKSGAKQGEPWHVGVGDAFSDMFSSVGGGQFNMDNIWSLFGNLGSDPSSIASSATGLLNQLLRGMTNLMGGVLGPAPEYKPDLYNKLVAGTQAAGLKLGGLPSLALGGALGGAGLGILGGLVDGFSGSPSARAVDVARLASRYWHGEELVKAVAIAGRESSWVPTAHRTTTRPKDPSKGDRGLWQINYVNDPKLMGQGLYSDPRQLFDPEVNAAAAWALYQQQGWRPWTAGAGGWQAGGDPMYGAKVDEARAAIREAGVGDIDTMTYAAMLPRSGRSAAGPMQFNNTFVLPGGNGGGYGGIDARRTANQVANYLEDEMNKRAARTN